ncbi:hypothetical protein Ae201684P_003437 [Aphanomyces euteiches]|uniref:Uncharacterized protein n=1 Tax=Aphanomyces euteiches TaxID=100861 RepID=A0A6G0W8A1_9STRA|nr:hypothetical protein Ae201684_017748 [Aphanomyces euteiches]KAH9064646.1 hypothetical protein Ae201684P_003437 [Aphanomyces euteiches]
MISSLKKRGGLFKDEVWIVNTCELSMLVSVIEIPCGIIEKTLCFFSSRSRASRRFCRVASFLCMSKPFEVSMCHPSFCATDTKPPCFFRMAWTKSSRPSDFKSCVSGISILGWVFAIARSSFVVSVREECTYPVYRSKNVEIFQVDGRRETSLDRQHVTGGRHAKARFVRMMMSHPKAAKCFFDGTIVLSTESKTTQRWGAHLQDTKRYLYIDRATASVCRYAVVRLTVAWTQQPL